MYVLLVESCLHSSFFHDSGYHMGEVFIFCFVWLVTFYSRGIPLHLLVYLRAYKLLYLIVISYLRSNC